MICTHLCLFVSLDFFVPLENFSLIWRRHRCRCSYAQHLWLLSSEGSLASHTYCDTGHPSTRDTHTYCLALSSGSVTTCFYDLGLLGWDSNTQPSTCGACSTAAVFMKKKTIFILINSYEKLVCMSINQSV